MKKIILSVVLALMLVSLIAVPVFAAPAGNSNTGHLYLYEKDTSWTVVPGGAWGKFNYKLSVAGVDGVNTTVSGVFNGHGLDAAVGYSLIYYPETVVDPWTAPPVVQLIGSDTANKGGNVHIAGTAIIGGPDTQPTVGDYIGQTGDKIWLVLSSDLDTTGDVTTMIGWTPAEYLFEDNLINTGD